MKYKHLNLILFIVFFLACEALLIGLGVWQYRRGQEKEAFRAAVEQRLAADSIPFKRASSADEWRQVTLSGTFDHTRSIFVTNARHGSRLGREVFTPLILAEAMILRTPGEESGESFHEVIVHRGWIPKETTPADIAFEGPVALSAVVRKWPESVAGDWLKGPGVVGEEEGIPLLLRASPELIPAKKSVIRKPFYVQATAGIPAVLKVADLPPRTATPHFQYMLTWWALALIVAGLGITWIYKSRRRLNN